MTPAALEEIERARLKSDLDASGPDWSEGDWAYHRTIYQYAGRPRQLAMIEALRRTCLLFVSAYATMPAKKPRWLGEHAAIVKHLRRGDAEQAVLALKGHLEAAATHLLAHMAPPP
jgi:DNA-binding GntR family transcriptional regulator